VVWWDPSSLELLVRPSIGLAQTRILEADDTGRASAAGEAYERWLVQRATTRERGGAPTRQVVPATEWTDREREILGAENVEVIEIARGGERPRGRRFGTLVHAVLSGVGLDDDREKVAEYSVVQARLLGASDEERDASVEAVIACLAYPLMRRAAAAAGPGGCRREVPLVIRASDGTLLESVVDLAFLEGNVWHVVDFKSDTDLERLLEGYRRQVALYVAGITEATGAPARGTILRI